MTRKLISTGSPFERTAGYSRAVVQGDWCFVAGTTGYDYANMTMPEAVEDQARNALGTIAKALAEAGFDMADVVRAHYYVTDRALVQKVYPVFGEAFGDGLPDMAQHDFAGEAEQNCDRDGGREQNLGQQGEPEPSRGHLFLRSGVSAVIHLRRVWLAVLI